MAPTRTTTRVTITDTKEPGRGSSSSGVCFSRRLGTWDGLVTGLPQNQRRGDGEEDKEVLVEDQSGEVEVEEAVEEAGRREMMIRRRHMMREMVAKGGNPAVGAADKASSRGSGQVWRVVQQVDTLLGVRGEHLRGHKRRINMMCLVPEKVSAAGGEEIMILEKGRQAQLEERIQ
jgi:hypothetical protein